VLRSEHECLDYQVPPDWFSPVTTIPPSFSHRRDYPSVFTPTIPVQYFIHCWFRARFLCGPFWDRASGFRGIGAVNVIVHVVQSLFDLGLSSCRPPPESIFSTTRRTRQFFDCDTTLLTPRQRTKTPQRSPERPRFPHIMSGRSSPHPQSDFCASYPQGRLFTVCVMF